MVVEMVPVKGGIGSIFHPPGSARTISGIFPANWWMDYATYHLLGEPETTIDMDVLCATPSPQYSPKKFQVSKKEGAIEKYQIFNGNLHPWWIFHCHVCLRGGAGGVLIKL